MKQPLHLKYRPNHYQDMAGQDDIMPHLATMIQNKKQHVYTLSGPSGVGKTTLARISSGALGVSEENLTEIDAATFNGVDAMRDLVDTLSYRPMSGSRRRAVIVDEAHRISAAGWDVLLKTFEETPAHAYIFLCTTDPGKIPRTIQTRSAEFKLKPIPMTEVAEVLRRVRDEEGLKTTDYVIETIAGECSGSMRQALVWLEQLADVTDEDAAIRVVGGGAAKSPAVLELCRLMVNPPRNTFSWDAARKLIQQMIDESLDAESIRYVVLAYFQKVALGSDKEAKALQALRVLSVFGEPFPSNSKAGMIIVPVAQLLRIGE